MNIDTFSFMPLKCLAKWRVPASIYKSPLLALMQILQYRLYYLKDNTNNLDRERTSCNIFFFLGRLFFFLQIKLDDIKRALMLNLFQTFSNEIKISSSPSDQCSSSL